MANEPTQALSEVLDQLESAVDGESVKIQTVINSLGHRSFASLILVFSLISTSPASAIPGLTATIAVIVFILVAQMVWGRESVWLPDFITARELSTEKLCRGIGWLRKPVRFVEKILKARLTFLFHRPWFWVPLLSILFLTMIMPFLELIPTSGSIASAVIALFAAGLLTRDGAVVMLSMILVFVVPTGIWFFGFSG